MTERLQGRVIAAHGRHYSVEIEGGALLKCFPRGKKNDAAVGDYVIISRQGQDEGALESILERKNLLFRSDESKSKQFAANVVGRTALRDLTARAWQHTAAERRAAKRWQEATTAGKTEDDFIDVTITEYGAATGTTLKQKATNMLPYDAILSALNARQAADSYEILARTAMLTRSGAYANQIMYGGTVSAIADIDAADVLTPAMIKKTVARMRNAKVGTIGGKYLALVSPYQSLDLREATGDTAWIASRNQQDITGINNGYIGDFGGCSFIESSRVYVNEDAGVGTDDVTYAHILGQEALAMAYAQAATGERPEARISPVVDKLQRFHHIGWYWFGGFKLFRPEASWELRTGTSLD
jgi:N4-gp56 family major capsid protein